VDPIASAVLDSWTFEPWLNIALAATGLVYWRGFSQLRVQLPARFHTWRRTAFFAGLAALWLALGSPIDAFADLLLQVHMLQHWLLMMVAAPLLWLGLPAVPLMRGLPRRWLRDGLGPLLAWPALQRALRRITQPWFAGLAWALITLLWHWPSAYELALRSQVWHDVEHISFLASALLFWYAVLLPWPARSERSPWSSVLLLAFGALFNTIFSASFAFSTRVFYPVYQSGGQLWAVDVLADQNAAGGFLLVATSIPMLIAIAATVAQAIEPPRTARPERPSTPAPRPIARARPQALPQRIARTRTLRRGVQWTLFAASAAIVLDGLLGPAQPSAHNLAGVLPWTYWRGALVIGLLVLGNLFCAVCPFTLSRRLAARWLGRRFSWPRVLSGKWPAVGLFATYLWAYETFALWDSPWWTAWILIGYFATAFLIEGLFPRGRFCRHICPIGQFQFVHSGVSPLEVQAIDTDTCSRCTTHDCLRGNSSEPGCPTDLFMPTKQGNTDCTFCLDCARACPTNNIALVSVTPGSALGRSRSPRPDRAPGLDVAAITLLLCFGGFLNAAAMTAPVARGLQGAVSQTNPTAAAAGLALGWAVALLVLPVMIALICARLSRTHADPPADAATLIRRFVPALVPISLAMWTAHFGFHLWTGFDSLSPATARLWDAFGLDTATPPSAAMALPPGTRARVVDLQILLLGIGLVASTAVAWRLARECAPRAGAAIRTVAPWFGLCALLYGLGVWVLLQPMAMRGVVMP